MKTAGEFFALKNKWDFAEAGRRASFAQRVLSASTERLGRDDGRFYLARTPFSPPTKFKRRTTMFGTANQLNPSYLQQQAQLQQQMAGAGQPGGYTQAVPAPRAPEVQMSLQALAERTEVLDKCLNELGARLRGIMRDVPPNANPAGVPQHAGATPIGNQIAQITNRTETLITGVRMLLDLLEL